MSIKVSWSPWRFYVTPAVSFVMTDVETIGVRQAYFALSWGAASILLYIHAGDKDED